jgi:uncharacterized protein (TIGR02145 family)
MRNGLLFTFAFLLPIVIGTFEFAKAQNVGIGTNTPNPSAKLDIQSTNSGLLPPRMTFAQRAAIPNPATGLIVWCTDCGSGAGELSFFDGTGWKATGVAGASTLGTPPLAPTNLTVMVSSPLLYAALTWTDVSTNETGYKIERKIGAGVFTQIAQVGTNVSTFNDSTIGQSTTYTYRVYGFNNAGNSAQYSNEFQITTYAVPTININSISAITNTTAIGGGTITSDGGASVTARGICWSTSTNPTIALTTKTTDGTGTGSFTSSMTGLTANTTYYVRAYATNSVGTVYGTQQTFTTTNTTFVNLPSVTIGTQIWSTKNLDVSTYRNGDVIPQVTDATQWANLTTGAWCWYNNDSATYAATYGRLYNWYAVNDPRGLAPQGWHVPTNSEWNKMTKYLDASVDTTCICWSGITVGGQLKSTTLWNSPNTGANNSSGFSGLPGGYRYNDGSFYVVGNGGSWWSASAFDSLNAWLRNLYYNNSNVYRLNHFKTNGFSVRVVRD